MAVVDINSTTIDNLESNPIAFNAAQHNGQPLLVKSEKVAIGATNSATSTYRFFRVRSSDSIKSLQIINTALTGGTDYDLGLYQTTADGGAEVDKDLYADGLTLATACPAVPHVVATAAFLEARFGDASTAVPGDVNQQVWEDLGLSSDPNLEYDIVLTANTPSTAAGTVALRMLYTKAGA